MTLFVSFTFFLYEEMSAFMYIHGDIQQPLATIILVNYLPNQQYYSTIHVCGKINNEPNEEYIAKKKETT